MTGVARVLGTVAGVVAVAGRAWGGDLQIMEPVERQVVQRRADSGGQVRVRGRVAGVAAAGDATLEAAIGDDPAAWCALDVHDGAFDGRVAAPVGGWHRLRVRVLRGGAAVAESAVERVGVGELFVVAGQSNSANHGEARQRPATDRVVTFDGTRWRIAEDPQPGASGGGGSFMPALGDALVEALDVPVGFVACGIGATSVREWLPAGVTFPEPPTIEARVRRTPDGAWTSDGAAFDMLTARMRRLGHHGFRAVLWHQGESDANQPDPTRTLPGELYRTYLGKVIEASRAEIGWDAPWFVAVATYHVPGDEAAPDIRAAQAAVVRDGLALAGPDTDALTGALREGGGRGVHFSAAGLRAHGAAWGDALVPWIRAGGPPAADRSRP